MTNEPVAYASPLIAGDGIDLVVRVETGRSRTLQLSVDEARSLARGIDVAALLSEQDAERRVAAGEVL